MRSLSPDEDREFLMVNLIKYRAKAKYADGRKTDLTGEQANSLYAPIGFIGQIGARVDYVGRVNDQMGNMNPGWDEIGVVRYPSRAKFFEMVTNPEFQNRAVHKDAGLEVSQVLLTESVPSASRPPRVIPVSVASVLCAVRLSDCVRKWNSMSMSPHVIDVVQACRSGLRERTRSMPLLRCVLYRTSGARPGFFCRKPWLVIKP